MTFELLLELLWGCGEESSVVPFDEDGNGASGLNNGLQTKDDPNRLLIQEALNRTAAQSKAAAAKA